MQHENISQAQMAQLLREAEQAHAEYEQELGERDDSWAEWYAGYILRRMSEEESEEG